MEANGKFREVVSRKGGNALDFPLPSITHTFWVCGIGGNGKSRTVKSGRGESALDLRELSVFPFQNVWEKQE